METILTIELLPNDRVSKSNVKANIESDICRAKFVLFDNILDDTRTVIAYVFNGINHSRAVVRILKETPELTFQGAGIVSRKQFKSLEFSCRLGSITCIEVKGKDRPDSDSLDYEDFLVLLNETLEREYLLTQD